MENSDGQMRESVFRAGVQTSPDYGHKSTQEKSHHETPGTSRATTRGSVRFGALSHHSFFSRHNPHPHRVRHIEGLNGKPICTVNDEWYGYTPLCPHPLIKSQVSVGGARSSVFLTPDMSSDPRSAFISESWQEELKDLATKVRLTAETNNDRREKLTEDEEVPRRKTQYSSQSGRIIPATSCGKKRSSRTSHRRVGTQRRLTHSLEGSELKVLELLCQILQTDSLSMVQQWLLLADDREKEMVQELLQQAMADSSAVTQQRTGSELLLTSEPPAENVILSLSASHSQRKRLNPAETSHDKPELIGQAEVLAIHHEDPQPSQL